MNSTGENSIRPWVSRAGELSRVWVCGHCGAKVYRGRLTLSPACRCLCGRMAWRRGGCAPAADRFH